MRVRVRSLYIDDAMLVNRTRARVEFYVVLRVTFFFFSKILPPQKKSLGLHHEISAHLSPLSLSLSPSQLENTNKVNKKAIMYAVASSAKVVVPTMQMKSTQSKRVAVKPVQALNVEKVRRVKFVAGEFRESRDPPFFFALSFYAYFRLLVIS